MKGAYVLVNRKILFHYKSEFWCKGIITQMPNLFAKYFGHSTRE